MNGHESTVCIVTDVHGMAYTCTLLDLIRHVWRLHVLTCTFQAEWFVMCTFETCMLWGWLHAQGGACHAMQGVVYHWTISTGFSLAEATNVCVCELEKMAEILCQWCTKLEKACAEVKFCFKWLMQLLLHWFWTGARLTSWLHSMRSYETNGLQPHISRLLDLLLQRLQVLNFS